MDFVKISDLFKVRSMLCIFFFCNNSKLFLQRMLQYVHNLQRLMPGWVDVVGGNAADQLAWHSYRDECTTFKRIDPCFTSAI